MKLSFSKTVILDSLWFWDGRAAGEGEAVRPPQTQSGASAQRLPPPVQHSLEGFLGAVCAAQGMEAFRAPGAGVKVLGQGQGLSWEASVTAVLFYSRHRNSL